MCIYYTEKKVKKKCSDKTEERENCYYLPKYY